MPVNFLCWLRCIIIEARNIKYSLGKINHIVFTREQGTEYIDVSINTITNIVKYLEEKWLLKIAKKSNLNRYNHVNFYLATIPTEFDDIKEPKNLYHQLRQLKLKKMLIYLYLKVRV